MIVKVQRPLGRGTRKLPWLVYSEGRRNMQRIAPSQSLRRDFGDDVKRYYEADLINGRWNLVKQVADQPW